MNKKLKRIKISAFFHFCCRKPATKPVFRPIYGRQISDLLQENIVLAKKIKERSTVIIKELTSKEKLFCTYYCISRNGREAATKSGYLFPEKSALRLLKRSDIQGEIEKIDQERKRSERDISAGYFRLAFGCISDAVKLLFSDDISEERIDDMDLFNISEIKRKKGGDVEIKFFDRLKALEHLQEMCEHSDTGETSLYAAIEKGAAALRGDSFE